MMLVAISAAAGVSAALLAVWVVSLLYQVSPYDPAIFSAVVLFPLGVGGAGCYTPALRASRADPVLAMRAE